MKWNILHESRGRIRLHLNKPRLSMAEADQLQEFIHKEHLNAFMSMLSTTEVFGKGFNHA